MNVSPIICVTKKLREPARSILRKGGFELIEMEMLDVTYRMKRQVFHDVLKESTPLVVTSAHAVNAMLLNKCGRKLNASGLFCISGETRQAASYLFIPVIDTASRAKDLADKIIKSGVREINYFCGNPHRPELTSHLQENGISVNEIIVYDTSLSHRKSVRCFEHVLFFSPRSAESFLQNNFLSPDAICFCIGETTASFLREHTQQKVVVSTNPTQEALAKATVDYFTTAILS